MGDEVKDIFFSVIIPAYNTAGTIKNTLASVFESDTSGFEVIVVDDGSTDRTIALAREFPCKLLSMDRNSGAAAARNAGAKLAAGEILLFIDSDIIIDKDTISNFRKAFENNSNDAVIGIYGKRKVFTDPFSTYKNLFLHFNQDVDSPRFWSGCGAIKKDVFFKLGGFNAKINGAFTEDTDFGYAILSAGYGINVLRNIQVTHNRRFTLASLFKNDFCKTVEWLKILMLRGIKTKTGGYYLNLRNFLSLLGILLLPIFALSAIIGGFPFVVGLGICFFVFIALNIKFILLLVKEAGRPYLILGPLLLVFSYTAVFLGLVYSVLSIIFKIKKAKIDDQS